MKRTGQGLHTPHVSGQSIRDRTLLLSGAKKTHGFQCIVPCIFSPSNKSLESDMASASRYFPDFIL